MNYSMEIGLGRRALKPDTIFTCRRMRLGARLFGWLFGRHKVVIIVPGGKVDSVTISEKENNTDAKP